MIVILLILLNEEAGFYLPIGYDPAHAPWWEVYLYVFRDHLPSLCMYAAFAVVLYVLYTLYAQAKENKQ